MNHRKWIAKLVFVYSMSLLSPHTSVALELQNGKPGSCYKVFNEIKKNHVLNSWGAVGFSFAGVGLPLLAYGVGSDIFHKGTFGNSLNRAEKLKNLIIAAGDFPEYQEMSKTKKRKAKQKKVYAEAVNEFQIFFHKLTHSLEVPEVPNSSSELDADSIAMHHPKDADTDEGDQPLLEENIRTLIHDADQLGLLCEWGLFKKMVEHNSFRPLRYVILTGQLQEKINRLTRLIASQEQLKQNATDHPEILNSCWNDLGKEINVDDVNCLKPKLEQILADIEQRYLKGILDIPPFTFTF